MTNKPKPAMKYIDSNEDIELPKTNKPVLAMTDRMYGLEKLAVEIMNITGGKYTDEQEQKMMAVISSEIAKANLELIKSLPIQVHIQHASHAEHCVGIRFINSAKARLADTESNKEGAGNEN